MGEFVVDVVLRATAYGVADHLGRSAGVRSYASTAGRFLIAGVCSQHLCHFGARIVPIEFHLRAKID